MRSRTPGPDVAEVARRRLERLAAELAAARERGAGPQPEHPTPAAEADVAPRSREQAHDQARDPAGDPAQQQGRHARRPLGAVARASSWTRDRLPPTVQGRVQLGASHLAVVALVVAAALAATAWWVTRAGPAGTAVPEPPVVEAPSPRAQVPGGAAPTGLATPAAGAGVPQASTGAAGEAGVVVVDVAGKVRRPGIVTLPAGSRVVDAVQAAGGARPGARTSGLNLARVLVDGEQVVVGVPAAAGAAAAAAGTPGAAGGGSPGALVNVNTADQTTLETLPGVGPVTAQAILAYRTENGPFTAVDELIDVSGIGEATLAEIAPHVTL
jgi:competence protein ComEA